MRASSADRKPGSFRAFFSRHSPASRQESRHLSEALQVDPSRRRRRLRPIKLFGLSPVTQVLLVVTCSLAIVYFLRDPLDRLLPGSKGAIESAITTSSEGIAGAAGTLSTTVGRLSGIGPPTIASSSGSAVTNAFAQRPVRLPYYTAVPARPRLAVPNFHKSKTILSAGCAEGCYLLAMPDASLEPAIKKGQLLLIDSRRVAAPGDVVWVAYRGTPYLRRFFPTGSDVRLAPDNPAFPEVRVSRKEVHINGVFLRIVDPGEK